jgi:putative endonuclease
MAWVYILRCSDGSYYTGSTVDLAARIWQHNDGVGANFTRTRRPVELVYAEESERVEDAFAREKQVQGWSRAKKEALIARSFEKLPELAAAYERRFPSAPSTSSGTTLRQAQGPPFGKLRDRPVAEPVEAARPQHRHRSLSLSKRPTPVAELVEAPNTGR